VNEPNTEKTIFAGAQQLPAEDRAAYLDEACGDNGPLRRRIEALLNASEQSGAFLEVSAAPMLRRTPSASIPLAEKQGDKVGRYKLLQQIGEGGCGVVYMAEQEEPVRRRVALKIIKLGMDTRNVIARFGAERQALAMMDHPNIAKVFDAGATETGRPYFVMELVRGVKITDYCDEQRLSTRERLGLFMQVCHAIQHAHQKGIIHRDIKPSNILVTVNDGVPVPKVIDFGIAKATTDQLLTDKTVFTAFEQFLGTPAYMSPEQAAMTSLDIDTRSDIYALGVLLYELLTGKTPFDAGELLAIGLDAMRRTICETEPERPSTRLSTMTGNELGTTAQRRSLGAPKLVSELRGDLDCVVMKALEKDRARRYETANGLAMDIQRHLNNEPIVARPPSKAYVLTKLARRHRLAFAAGAIVAFTLLAGILVSSWYAVRSARAERVAENERRQAEVERTKAQEAEAEAKAVNDFLKQDVLRQVRPDVQTQSGLTVDPNITVRQALDHAAKRLGSRFTNQPLVEASIRMTLAWTYEVLGEDAAALRNGKRALELRERILGTENPLTLEAMETVTRQTDACENPAEAVALCERAYALDKRLRGPEDRQTLTSMDCLGRAYGIAGRLNKAVAVSEESFKLHKAKFGPQDETTLWSMVNLVQVYYQAGRYEEALPLSEENFRLWKAGFGQDHLGVWISMIKLSSIYRHAGRLKEAMRLGEESVKLCKAMCGPESRHTLGAMDHLAADYLATGRLNEALALFEETLKVRDNKLGHEHPDVLENMINLAGTYQMAGKLDEALRLYQESLNLCKTKLAAGHRVTLAAMNGLAEFFESTGQKDKGVSLREEALKLSQAYLGPEDSATLETMIRLASCYRNARRLKEAAQLDETAIKLCKEKLGIQHNFTLLAMNNLAQVYEDAGRLDEALSLYEQTLKLYKANQGPDHPSTLAVMCNLGDAYAAAGQTNKAVSVYEEAVKLLKSRIGPGQPWTLTTMNNLALAYQDSGRADEALPLLEETLKIRKVALGQDHPDTLRTMNNVASAYEKAGRLTEALPLYEQSAKGCFVKIGPDDPDTVGIINNYVLACEKARGIAEAERVFRGFPPPDLVGKPRGSALLRARGRFLARHAVWSDAAADFSHIIQFKPDDAYACHSLAAILIQEGQLDAYRKHCRKSIERFGNTMDPVTAERIAKDCLILPESGADLDTVARMARTALNSTTNLSDPAWCQLVQGLADYRQGRFAPAADWAEKALAKPGTNSERDVQAYMVQAMACQRLNLPDKARAALATGKELAETKLPKLEGGDLGGYWLDWVTAQVLLREASTLIEGQTPSVKGASK